MGVVPKACSGGLERERCLGGHCKREQRSEKALCSACGGFRLCNRQGEQVRCAGRRGSFPHLCLVLLEGLAGDLSFHLRDDAISLGLRCSAATVGGGACRSGLRNVISGDQKKAAMAKIGGGKERCGRGDIGGSRDGGLRKRNDRPCHELSPSFRDPVAECTLRRNQLKTHTHGNSR